MPAVEPRYAAGLLGAVANQGADAEKIAGELEEFTFAIQDNAELRRFLLDPVVPPSAKKSAIKQLFHGEADKLTEHLLCLMVDKGRLGRVSGVTAEFNRMYAEAKGVLRVKVFSAEPLDAARLDEIAELYRKKYGSASAKAENITNPALLGGVRVQIGDMLYDATLAAKLRGLAAATAATINEN